MAYPIGATHTTFGRYLDNHGVHPDDKRATGNWDEIMDMVEQPRPDQAQSALYQVQYEAFLNLQMEAESERDVGDRIFPLIGGNGVGSDKEHIFSNLEGQLDANIVKVTPGYCDYDGADPKKTDKELLAELRTFEQPLKVKKSPVFPNFFAESKVPKYELAIAEQQARYAGAIGSIPYDS